MVLPQDMSHLLCGARQRLTALAADRAVAEARAAYIAYDVPNFNGLHRPHRTLVVADSHMYFDDYTVTPAD